jgi:phosphonate transport system substrate-binding protein
LSVLKNRRWFNGLLVGLLLSLSLIGCQPTPTPEPEPAPTATLQPSPTPTPAPLGSPDNPIILGIVPAETAPDQASQAAALALKLSELTGVSVDILVLDSYDLLLAEMDAGNVQLTFLQPLTYLAASQNQIAEVALLTSHFGVYYYGAQFLANVESGFSFYFDPDTNLNTADAATALAQFNGMKPCWADSTSISGYVLPAGILAQNEIDVDTGALIPTQTGIIRALYIKGVCDFGVTFAISGDPRTSSAVIADLPDVRERVRVVWQSDPEIPNLNLSYTPSLPAEMRPAFTQAFLDLCKTEEGKAQLSAAAGGYEIQDMRVVDDSVYDPLRDAVNAIGYDIYNALGR